MSDRQTVSCISAATSAHRSAMDMEVAIYWLLLAVLSQNASVNVSDAIDRALRAPK